MADSTLDITQAFDRPAKFLKLIDNGDGTYSVAADLFGSKAASGAVITTRDDDFYNDAFQRLRVSDTDQRFDGDFSYDLSPRGVCRLRSP